MDTPVCNHIKLGLKGRYAAMTQGLAWETSYQPKEKVFACNQDEGIKIHDWDKWEDPFRLTMDGYWKIQAEKERKLYAVIDAFAQNNGQLGLSDARYVNALKLFVQAITPLEYCAHRGFAHVGRQFSGAGARVGAQMQSIDELRHFQTQIHANSHYNKYFNGMHSTNHWFDNLWYLSVPKSYFEDAFSAGPLEFVTAMCFCYGAVLSNLAFVPFMSGATYNGDMATAACGFSAQSDESRHLTLGIECVKFMLEQDPQNVPIVQRWMDKWFWRGYRMLTLVAMMQDYMLPRRVLSWKEAWEMYVEGNAGALFKDLARYGIREPKGWRDACEGKDHISHQAWNTFYNYNDACALHLWVPEDDELQWLSEKYPREFDRWYRPRLEFFRTQQRLGQRVYNRALPMQCQTCQWPLFFTEPGDPSRICHRQIVDQGISYHFCSDHCQEIFGHEPQKYRQARLSSHRVLQGECFLPGVSSEQAGFDRTAAVLDYCRIQSGRDNLDFENSQDQVNFREWLGQTEQGA